MLAAVRGKRVLDVGCAEGLISIECAKRGATSVLGVEIVASHIASARAAREAWPCVFKHADAARYTPKGPYDVVLLLAVLHKLRDPTDACRRYARLARELCVIRLPARSPDGVIVDARSGDEPQDIGAAMSAEGFALMQREDGPRGEPTWYFRR